MRSVSYRLADLKKNVTVPLGFRGENEHTRIIIDCKKAFDEYPDAIPSLAVSPPNGTAYPAVIVREGDLVYWDIRDSDLAKEGRGTAQLTFTEDGVVRKDDIFNTVIGKSILPAGPAPDPIADWITEANRAIGTIEGAIETAQEAAEAASGSATEAAGSVAAAANQATAAAGSAEAAQTAAVVADTAKKELENMLAAGVEEVVEDWLDDHPEATTTVEDGAVSRIKLDLDLKEKTDSAKKSVGYFGTIGQTTEKFTTAELARPDKIMFVGNEYAFSTCKYANRANVLPRSSNSGTSDGLPWTVNNYGFMTLNGASASTGDISYFYDGVSVPAGSYRLFVNINPGTSIISDTATYKIRWWYKDSSVEHYATVSLSDSDGYIDVVFEQDVRSINIRTGKHKNNTYSGFVVWYGLYRSDVTIVDTEHSVNNNDTYTYSIDNPALFSVIDTMQHKCIVEYVATGKDSNPVITPEQFGAVGDANTNDASALQECINYAILNNAIVYGRGQYRVDTPIIVHGNYQRIYLNSVTSWVVTGYVIEICGISNVIEINKLNSSAGSGVRVCSYNGSDCRTNYFNIRRIYITGNNKKCIMIEGDTSDGTPQYVSYNAFMLGDVYSAHGNCIEHGEYASENEFYNAKIRCPEGWGFYNPNSARCFGLSFEGDVFGGIYLNNKSSGTFIGCRHVELTEKIPMRQYGAVTPAGGTLIKVVGFRHDLLYETNENVPYQAIDTSEAADITSESMDTSDIDYEWRKDWNRFKAATAQKIIRCPIVYGHYNNKNGGVLLGNEMAILAGKKICKPAIRSEYVVTEADFDMRDTSDSVTTNNHPYATKFIINVANCVIHLASSYCCEGYDEFIVDQSDSTKLCTIYNSYDDQSPIFDGETLGEGVYKLTCYCDYEATTEKLPARWVSDGYTTTFYTGYNDKWTVEKIG